MGSSNFIEEITTTKSVINAKIIMYRVANMSMYNRR